MKQFITICILALLSLAGTQTAQAQTKEETIKWIKEALEAHEEFTYYKDVKVHPCKISFIAVLNDEFEDFWYVSFNPSKAKNWKVCGFNICTDSDIIRSVSEDGEEENSNKFEFHVYGSQDISSQDISDVMAKALNHLATFCEEDEK